jgi:hypothetical protein
MFRDHAAKLEEKKISYACLAHVVRQGGFKVALIARLSAVPGHCKYPLLISITPFDLIIKSFSHHRHFLHMRHE